MTKKCLLVALLVLSPVPATAENQSQLVERYSPLAGSTENATSLVTGLREGKEVTLTRGSTTETFTPPTGAMGYGNVSHALALAELSLRQQDIASPTPAQLEAAVMEVLQMRADGKGWGEIAQARGVKLGEVKRPERVARVERPSRPEKPERPQKPERPEKPARPR